MTDDTIHKAMTNLTMAALDETERWQAAHNAAMAERQQVEREGMLGTLRFHVEQQVRRSLASHADPDDIDTFLGAINYEYLEGNGYAPSYTAEALWGPHAILPTPIHVAVTTIAGDAGIVKWKAVYLHRQPDAVTTYFWPLYYTEQMAEDAPSVFGRILTDAATLSDCAHDEEGVLLLTPQEVLDVSVLGDREDG